MGVSEKKYSSAKDFLKKIAGFSVATWIGFALSFFSTPITTRLFSPDDVGKINLFSTYMTLFLLIATLGLDQSLVRFYYEPLGKNDKNGIFNICFKTSFFFTLFVSGGILLFGNSISREISGVGGWTISICLVLSLIANIVLKFFNMFSRLEQKVVLYSVQAILLTIVGRLFYVIVALWNPTYLYAIIAMTLGYILIAVIFWVVQKKYLKKALDVSRSVYRALFAYALPLLPVGLLSWLNNSLAQLLLKKYVDYSAIGIYSNAVSVASIISLLQSGFNIYWAPYVYERYQTEKDKIQKIHQLITFAMVAFGIMIVLGQDILYLIIGEKFRASKEFFAFLLVSPICYTIAETTGLGIGISKKSYWNILVFSCNALVNLILCNFLLPRIGIVGASVSAAASAIIMLVVKTAIGERYYKCVTSYWKTFLALIIMVAAAVFNYYFVSFYLLRYAVCLVLLAVLVLIYWKQVKYLYGFSIALLKNLFRKESHSE